MNRQSMIDSLVSDADFENARGEKDLSISDLITVLLNKRWTILLITIVVAAAGTYLSSKAPITYSARATIALNPTLDIDERALGNMGAGIDNSVVESEIHVLKSRNMLESVIDEAGIGVVKQWLSDDHPISDPDLEKNRLVSKLLRVMSVLRRDASYILEVEVTAQSPLGAAAISNAITDSFINSKESDVTIYSELSQKRRAQRLEDLREELAQRNRAVADFIERNGLVSANGSTLVEQTITDTRRNLATARNSLFDVQARLNQLYEAREKGGYAEGVSEIQNSGVMTQLRTREIEIRRRIAELSQTYSDNHPDLISARSELEDITGQIEIEIDVVTASLERTARTAQDRVLELEEELTQLQGNLNVDQRARVRLDELRREVEATERIYRDLFVRNQDFADRAQRQAATARLLSRAVPPTAPSSPPLELWAAFWTGVGLFLGLGAAIFLNLFQNTIIKTEDAERYFGTKALVAVPYLQNAKARKAPAEYILQSSQSIFAECYRVILSELMINLQTPAVAAVTSAIAGDGKTTTSMCLAYVAAETGLKVAVVDCDFRLQSLSKKTKGEKPKGFQHIFHPDAKLNKAYLADPDLPNLHVFPIDGNVQDYDRSAHLTSAQDVFERLRKSYDLVLLDCAPVLAVANTRIFTSAADATIVVARWKKTPIPAIRTTLQQISRADGVTLGIVLNAVNVSVAKNYSHGDTLYFGKAGKGYYTT